MASEQLRARYVFQHLHFMKSLPMHAVWAWPLLLGLSLPSHAQTMMEHPERALLNTQLTNGTASWELLDGVGMSSMKVVSPAAGDVGGARRALELNVQTAPNINAWDISLRQDVGVSVASGQALRLSFWAKADKIATINAGVEDRKDYHKIVWSGDTALSTDWKRYEVVGKADHDFAVNDLHFLFNLGFQNAKVQITNVRLEDPAHPIPAQLAPAGPVASLDHPFSLLPATGFEVGYFGSGLAVENMPAQPNGHGPVARLTVATQPQNAWNALFKATNPVAVNGGDAVAVRVWARSATKSRVGFIFQQSAAPNDKFVSETATLSPEWKEYRFIGILDNARSFAAGGSNFEIHAGYGAGTVEIANVRVEDFGQSSREEVSAKIGGETIDLWGGRAHDDSWRAAALARIEKNRKADLKVRVVDVHGKPVRGAKIEAKMTRHDFRFGSAITSTPFWTSDSEVTRRFKEIAAQNFNTITIENGLKWPSDSPNQHLINDSILTWAKANNIEVRGHNLVWGSTQFMPKEIGGKKLADLSNDELKAGIEAHVRDYVRRYKGRVYVWDVVNEAVAERDIWDRVGWDEFARVFKIAREEDPQVLLAYNDYKLFHIENELEWKKEQEVIGKLIAAGVPLDILGEQAHLGTPFTPIPTILSNLSELGSYGKSIEITEFDLGARDEAGQAAYMSDFLTACFSEPKVVSFIQWGFWEGAHWRAKEGGHLVNRDFSFKPAMNAYRDLVFKQWWTNASGQSDIQGAYGTRGFKGSYTVSVSKNGQSATQAVHLDDKTGIVTLVLK